MMKNPSALTVVHDPILGGSNNNFYQPVFRCLLALIVSLLISPGYAQKSSGFDDFIKTLDKTAVGNRQKVAEQFMAKVDQTPVVEVNAFTLSGSEKQIQ